MPGKKGLPRCKATTMKNVQCKASAVKDGLCPCHHPDLATAWKERNRVALRAYWQTKRVLEALAATASA
jgi:hypothetical protein